MKRWMFLVVIGVLLAAPAVAEDYGLTAQEAYEAATDPAGKVLLVDVRDPVEIMFIGWTDVADINIPFLLVDRFGWNAERGGFPLPRNPEFAAQVRDALEKHGLAEDATIITMCRSGSSRGAPSAQLLRESGFPNAYYVLHGFQGDRVSEGAQAGMRLKNGWQNEGLPWQARFNPDKIFRPGS
ncbi:MAG TPA: rhodanese-like domain-containing protein [Wenzhouxiangella sp.]|nr:rhodanese-like domain-containing protein [Wenzhouxiangella sp.]